MSIYLSILKIVLTSIYLSMLKMTLLPGTFNVDVTMASPTIQHWEQNFAGQLLQQRSCWSKKIMLSLLCCLLPSGWIQLRAGMKNLPRFIWQIGRECARFMTNQVQYQTVQVWWQAIFDGGGQTCQGPIRLFYGPKRCQKEAQNGIINIKGHFFT